MIYIVSQKCMQICHVVDIIYADFLKVLGTRIERDLAAVMNSASFAGSGEDQDCDTCYEERFSVLEVGKSKFFSIFKY